MRNDFHNCLLVTDLDGTFFGSGARLVQRNLDALRLFKERGGRFTVATGRIHVNVLKAFPNAAEICNAPGIMANGSFVYDFSTGRRMCEYPLPTDLGCEVIRFAHEAEPGAAARISTGDGLAADSRMTNGYVEWDLNYYKGNGEIVFSPIDEWDLDRMTFFKIVFRGDADTLARLRPHVEKRFGDRLEYCASSPEFFELQAVGCHKGQALLNLKATLERESGEAWTTFAIGDYENDLPMLRAADRSACPVNAMEAVKAVVDDHVCHCNEGAIADWLERL